MAKRELKVGDRIKTTATTAIIGESLPCDRAHCIQSKATLVELTKMFGSNDFDMRSTNMGAKWRLGGYRYVGTFTPVINKNLLRFDAAFQAVAGGAGVTGHQHTRTEAKAIAKRAFLDAKRAGTNDREATKLSEAAYRDARKPMAKADATDFARNQVKPFKGEVIITEKRKVSVMTTSDKVRLRKKQEQDRKEGVFKLRRSRQRQISA